MKQPISEVVQNTRSLITNQLVIGLILIGFFWFKSGNWAAVSAMYMLLRINP